MYFIWNPGQSWNLGIDQFEYFRSSGVSKAVEEANFIKQRIENICKRHNLDFEKIAENIIAAISDNAPAAVATRKHLIRLLDEIAPLAHKRKSLSCSVHWVSWNYCNLDNKLSISDRSSREIYHRVFLY